MVCLLLNIPCFYVSIKFLIIYNQKTWNVNSFRDVIILICLDGNCNGYQKKTVFIRNMYKNFIWKVKGLNHIYIYKTHLWWLSIVYLININMKSQKIMKLLLHFYHIVVLFWPVRVFYLSTRAYHIICISFCKYLFQTHSVMRTMRPMDDLVVNRLASVAMTLALLHFYIVIVNKWLILVK